MRPATLLALSALLGCASSTVIQSDPPGAQVFVDGAPVGVTPVYYTDGSTWDWSHHQITIQKAGYQTVVSDIAANSLDAGRLVLGIFLCWPVLLSSTNYQPSYGFRLAPGQSAQPPYPQNYYPGSPPPAFYVPPPQVYVPPVYINPQGSPPPVMLAPGQSGWVTPPPPVPAD